MFFFYLLFHRSFHLVKGIASSCGHARVKAFAVTKLSLPHPLVEIRRYIRQQRTAIHCLEFSFGVTPQTFNVVGVHAVGTHVFHRVVHCLVLVSQIYNVIEIVNIKRSFSNEICSYNVVEGRSKSKDFDKIEFNC